MSLPEDPSENEPADEPISLPPIPWSIRLRYHVRKFIRAARERFSEESLPNSFELEDQVTNGCLHFVKAYFLIMLPLAIGLFFGAHALQWDHHIEWDDTSTWPFPWRLIEELHDEGFNGGLMMVSLPFSLPVVMMFKGPAWFVVPYMGLIFGWYAMVLRGSPNYGKWIPLLVAVQAWGVVVERHNHRNPMVWVILAGVTLACIGVMIYFGWWKPKRDMQKVEEEKLLLEYERERKNADVEMRPGGLADEIE